MASSTSKAWSRTATQVAMLAFALIFLFPLYWLIVSAFKSSEQIFALPPVLWPSPATADNFRDLFQDTPIVTAFINTTIIAVLNCLLSLFLCSLAGFAFAKYPHAPGNHPLFLFVLGTMMIPVAVTLIPVFVILMKLGWINTYWAMIIPGAANAFGIFWIRQYMHDHVPDALLDAARMDGCREFGIYWRIALPIARPALAALAVMILIGSWNNLMWAFIILQTEDMQTLPLLTFLLQDEIQTPFGILMSCGLVTTAPLLLAFFVFQRQFISGLSAGAVKA